MTWNHRNSSRSLSAALACAVTFAGAPLGAQQAAPPATISFAGFDVEAPDFADWECSNCGFRYGWSGEVKLGAGYSSDQLFEFGDDRGLDDEGVHAEAGVDVRYRGEDAVWLEIYGEDLGLEKRDFVIQGGRQGRHAAWLRYDEILKLRADDTRTPFLGDGTGDQRLPADWVRGQVTGDMTALDATLRPVDIRSKRETAAIGAEWTTDSPLQFGAELRHTRRDGNRIKGGSFIFRAVELASPVRYDTTELDASVAYVRNTWELEAGYTLSEFENAFRSLRFDNPFIGINGASEGELAEAPDNRFQQFTLSGSWRPSPLLTLAGQAAIGRIEQDQALVDYTLNPNLPNPALPRGTFDGEVDTRVLNLRATSRINSRLSARATLEYNERDNDSPRDPWLQVVSDTFATGERINEPYSYERRALGAQFDYRAFSWLRLSGAAKRTETERDFQEVRDTDTDRYSLQARIRAGSRVNFNIESSREHRDNDLDPALLGSRENPSLRRFHFAEKDRDALRIGTTVAVSETLSAGLHYEIADEDYSDPRIGLSRARSQSLGIDVSRAFGDRASLNAWLGYERLEGTIFGADDVTGSPWTARQNDEFRTAGIGLRFHRLGGAWKKAAFDFNYADAEGDLSLSKRGVFDPHFPELKTRRLTFEATAERQMKENLDLLLGYLVGRLNENDFFRDDVEPATVPNLLSLGEGTPGGTVHLVSAALRYRFR